MPVAFCPRGVEGLILLRADVVEVAKAIKRLWAEVMGKRGRGNSLMSDICLSGLATLRSPTNHC